MSGPRKLSVLHLIITLGEANGQYNEHCLPLMYERDISICSFFTQLTPPPSIRLFSGDGSVRGFFRALRQAFAVGQYDVVHVHAPHTAVMLVLGLLASGRYRRHRRSLVYTVQDSFYDYKLRNQIMMVLALPLFARIVFCSRAAYESLPKPWKALVRGRWRIVQNGADLDRVDHAIGPDRIDRDDGPFTVVSVGRMEAVKDPVCVVDAFAAGGGPDARLVMIGRGALEMQVRSHVDGVGLTERVEMTGLIPRDDVFRRFASADVFVSASHGEGLPVAVIEAMAAGCPVVLSDIAPHREVADGADFISFVPVGDRAALGREIARIRMMAPSERRSIGKRCREHVLERFSLDVMHDHLNGVYSELVPDLATTVGR
jgi:glycosyltransferase involved in cell wall biosynthesis